MQIMEKKPCRFCKNYGILFKKNGGIKGIGCKELNARLTPDVVSEGVACTNYEEDLLFKTVDDVESFVCDRKCSGCEYAHYDHDGDAYPGNDDGNCAGCYTELDGFYDDCKKLPLNELIDKYTYGNDKLCAFYICGNFEQYFRGYQRVKKGDTSVFVKRSVVE